MPNTYSQIYIQIVFAVKHRKNLIHENNRVELQKYMSGIIENRTVKLLAIYCNPDHIHILVNTKPSVVLSDLVRDIKAGSSKFINEKNWMKEKFSWQEGFGAFSYSYSAISNVINYINNQKAHHQKQTFKKEYLEHLDKFDVEYEEKYLFEWLDA